MQVNAARLQHLRDALAHVPAALRTPAHMHLEFGVRDGISLKMLANISGADGAMTTWDGFDSWEGLPESKTDQSASRLSWGKGAFKTTMPTVPSNVRLHRGFFDATLLPFLDERRGALAGFVHLDADLYSSSMTVLCGLCSRCMLARGTVLSFDELYGKNLKALAHMEWAALQESAAACGFTYRFITWMLHKGPATRYGRVAVQIDDPGQCGSG